MLKDVIPNSVLRVIISVLGSLTVSLVVTKCIKENFLSPTPSKEKVEYIFTLNNGEIIKGNDWKENKDNFQKDSLFIPKSSIKTFQIIETKN